MPVFRYQPENKKNSCSFCVNGFDYLHRKPGEILKKCPQCKNKVVKIFVPFAVGFSKTGFDSLAKSKGFHKLKKVDRGKYEKLY